MSWLSANMSMPFLISCFLTRKSAIIINRYREHWILANRCLTFRIGRDSVLRARRRHSQLDGLGIAARARSPRLYVCPRCVNVKMCHSSWRSVLEGLYNWKEHVVGWHPVSPFAFRDHGIYQR